MSFLSVSAMSKASLRALCIILLLGSGLSVSWAAKPQWVEEGHAHKEKGSRGAQAQKGQPAEGARDGSVRVDARAPGVSVQVQIGGYFDDAQRRAARAYYEPRWRAGKCPPGLAKKGSGCQPPGQAKQWHLGEPLPRDVVYYPVPTSVQVRLGTPPAGHKFVRVATDILLIAIGTGMVIDAIEDLGKL